MQNNNIILPTIESNNGKGGYGNNNKISRTPRPVNDNINNGMNNLNNSNITNPHTVAVVVAIAAIILPAITLQL
jgi:hypothetical protein